MTHLTEAEVIERTARAIHKAKGYDEWPHPSCTQCESAAQAALSAIHELGLVIVPREPTEEMEEVGSRHVRDFDAKWQSSYESAADVYRAMSQAHTAAKGE